MAKFYVRTGADVDVGVGTTGGAVADLPNTGVSYLTAREVYTLAPPFKGARKTLVCTSTTTSAGTVVRASTGTTIAIHVAGGVTGTQTSFAAATTGTAVQELIGLSSVAWAVVSNSVIGASAAGIAVGTS